MFSEIFFTGRKLSLAREDCEFFCLIFISVGVRLTCTHIGVLKSCFEFSFRNDEK